MDAPFATGGGHRGRYRPPTVVTGSTTVRAGFRGRGLPAMPAVGPGPAPPEPPLGVPSRVERPCPVRTRRWTIEGEEDAVRYVWMLQVALLVLAPAAVYAYRHRRTPQRAVRGAGLIVTATYTGFFGLFVVGETLTDPGGWVGVGLVAAWLLPVGGLAWLAWRRPDRARPVLTGLVLAVAGVFVWSALDPDAWGSFEDDTGPVRGVLSLALTAPLALLALRYLRDAGVLLLVLGALPVALLITGGGRVPWSMAVLDLPVLVVGALFLLAARLDGASPARTTPRGPMPARGGFSR